MMEINEERKRLDAAENVCRELRFLLTEKVCNDTSWENIIPLLLEWMKLVPENVKYTRKNDISKNSL